jgi:hypothetical protein
MFVISEQCMNFTEQFLHLRRCADVYYAFDVNVAIIHLVWRRVNYTSD